ncbi:hypothetical protein PG994_010976 [Apiospora phragmitis]|uniref:RNase MRP protein 1 RNA binding domain-containing protein n=1 Tax=Apiospora phragmitis TaxID=2905665 RepID=A0ABR1TRH1_9PEZI
MSTTAKTQPIPDSSNIYHETLRLIRPLQPLLAGFNHRNKNQHRVATWWASFNMLRRHVTKWADELDLQAKARPKKRKRTTAAINQGDDGSSGPAEVRALWLRDVLMPKCYLTFSQLAADNQFASLGLVLTGALAQLHSTCVRLVGEAPSESDEVTVRLKSVAAVDPEAASPASLAATTTGKGKEVTQDTTTVLPSSSASAPASVAIRRATTRIGDDDVGQVISRDSVRATKGGHSPTEEEEKERSQKAKRRKKAREEDVANEKRKPFAADIDVGSDVTTVSTGKTKKGAATRQPKLKDGEKPPGEKEKKKRKSPRATSLIACSALCFRGGPDDYGRICRHDNQPPSKVP